MTARSRSIPLFVALLLSLAGSARAGSPHLEDIDADAAFERLSQTRGVVFVNLYADW
jgi:hypothetical protein